MIYGTSLILGYRPNQSVNGALKKAMKEKFFNYGKSFVITENNKENTPRFLIEAKCVLDNIDYYLCAPCKGENTFNKKDLFEVNRPFEFTPIISANETVIFRNFRYFLDRETGEYKRAYKGNEVWGDKKFFIKEVELCKINAFKISL